jgi:HAE1 family hydrophobic/amphiphilic exporter-1
MGKDKITATLDGRKEIGFSAMAITMVDVVVFAPIALMDTVIGDVLRQYSVTIVISTLMSLFVCYTLTPWLASRFGRVTHLNRENRFHRFLMWFESLINKLVVWYTGKLRWTLDHKLITTLGVLGAFAITAAIMSMGMLGQEMVASGDRGKVLVKLEFDKRTTLIENNIRTLEIESYLLSQNGVQTVFSNVGGGSTKGAASGVGSENKSEIVIGLTPQGERDIVTTDFMLQVKRKIESTYPGVDVKASVVGITDTQEPIQIVLTSEDQNSLMDAAKNLSKRIELMPGANNVSVSVEVGNPELTIAFDRKKMALLGLNVEQIGQTLQNAYLGNTDAKYRVGNNEYDINVRFDEFDRNNQMDVEDVRFVNNSGHQIALRQFAKVGQSSGPSMLERKDRRTSVTVKSHVLGTTSGELANKINESLANEPLSSAVEVRWTGDIEQQADSFQALGLALFAAILLVYLVMVALYDSFVYPFVVLFSVPVSLIGAFIALNLAMSTLSIFTMLGIIMLIGLVMKNGILLVDFANQRKAEGQNTLNALIDAGEARLRPILMTTIAMVIGMLPIALAGGAGSEWKNGLAIVMIGGLLSSLVLTVFVVPLAYYVVDMLKEKWADLTKRNRFSNEHIGLPQP